MQLSDSYELNVLEDKIVELVKGYTASIPRPFSILLSGGFDSGLLAALTSPDTAYTVQFPGSRHFDESHYTDAIIRHLGLENRSRVIDIGEEEFKKHVDEAIKVFGEVTSHFSLVPLYFVFKKMQEDGVKDVLSGEGPDEYLGGYARQIIFDELKKLYEIPELHRYHGIIEKVIGDRLSCRYYGELVGYKDQDVFNWINKNEDFITLSRERGDIQGLIGKMDMELGHIEVMEQKMAKHFGITLHYPYINDDFAEYCYNLRDDLKIRNGVTKWGFKQIALKYLPEIMRGRIKTGGPVIDVNKVMGWTDISPYDKSKWIAYQREVLNK